MSRVKTKLLLVGKRLPPDVIAVAHGIYSSCEAEMLDSLLTGVVCRFPVIARILVMHRLIPGGVVVALDNEAFSRLKRLKMPRLISLPPASGTLSMASCHEHGKHKLTLISAGPYCRPELCARMAAGLAMGRTATAVEWVYLGRESDARGALDALHARRLPPNFTCRVIDESAGRWLDAGNKADWMLWLPEASETMPYEACEAMARGVPVVATATAGGELLLDDSEAGLLMPVDLRREEFVRAMLPYLDIPVRYDAMREEAVGRSRSHFGAAAVYNDFFKNLDLP